MRVVCFGDSVTKGVSLIKGRLRIVKESYPALLYRFIGDKTTEVLNKGVFNDNSTLMVNRMDDDVIAHSPDYAIIEVGGNDCNFDWAEVAKHPDDAHDPIVPLNMYIDNLRNIVSHLKQHGITPIVMTILPLDPVRYYRQIVTLHGKNISHWIALCGGIEHWHGNYNRLLRRYTEEARVPTIDLRSAFKTAGNFSELISDDGIHPTQAGYKAIAGIVRNALIDLGISDPSHRLMRI